MTSRTPPRTPPRTPVDARFVAAVLAGLGHEVLSTTAGVVVFLAPWGGVGACPVPGAGDAGDADGRFLLGLAIDAAERQAGRPAGWTPPGAKPGWDR